MALDHSAPELLRKLGEKGLLLARPPSLRARPLQPIARHHKLLRVISPSPLRGGGTVGGADQGEGACGFA